MKRLPSIFILFVLTLSCIENNVPYPLVVPGILGLKVEGASSVEINSATRSVNVVLEETTDIYAVEIGQVSFSEKMTVSVPDLNGVFDLSQPLAFTLRTYQDYPWTLVATQEIKRYFTIEGQIGSSVIDVENRRVVAYVSKNKLLSQMTVLSCKLGPEGAVYSLDILSESDFTEPMKVELTVHGRREEWCIHIIYKDMAVMLDSVDPWTRVAWLSASGVAGQDNGFRYRQTGTEVWQTLSGDGLVTDGGSFMGCVEGLIPETEYECVAYSGTAESEVCSFVTGREEQLPNNGFEVYSKAESSNYYSWYDPASQLWNSKWWDSGNAGSTMVGASASICNPDVDDKVEGECSARLNSRYVVIKFAAGNLFCGSFAGLVGTSGGMVDFGRPFTERPRKMVLSLKYVCGAIDYVNSYPDGAPVSVGDPDCCQVFVALGDWDYRKYGGSKDSPVRVNTTKKETFFDPRSEGVIAYGSYTRNSSTDDWIRVEIPLEYNSVSRVPSHIIVSCAASMLGDYFTGSSSSILWVDDIRLEY